MLPHKHFLIAAMAILVFSALFPRTMPELAGWIVVGGLVSAIIDMDVVALVYLKSGKDDRLKPFRNPVYLFRNYGLFMDTITETGILKTGVRTHMVLSILFILLFYAFSAEYFIPVLIAVATHILSDIPSIQRLRAV